MLTVDDCNTILKKYKNVSFWYDIDLGKCDWESNDEYLYDFCRIKKSTGSFIIYFSNIFYTPRMYVTSSNGTVKDVSISWGGDDDSIYLYADDTDILKVLLTTNPAFTWTRLDDIVSDGIFLPVSSLQIPIVNEEYDDKFYIKPVHDSIRKYYYNTFVTEHQLTLETDDKGKFLRLPPDTYRLGVHYDNYMYQWLYNVEFREFKTLPNMSIPSLYKGTSQEVKLYNEDTEEYITEFQAYYQGRKLKDNIINLPYDCDDIIDIVIDILDPNYPTSRVKLKAPTTVYAVTSQAELENAINNGISCLKVVNEGISVSLNAIELNNITLIDSKLSITNCILDNIKIIWGESQTFIQDKGGNQISNCAFDWVDLGFYYKESSVFNNCTLKNTRIEDVKFKFSGRLEKCYLYNVLIISDGDVELTENRFIDWGFRRWPYFPSYLYLTGNYTVKDNTFQLSGTWTEPAFNMCIIKTLDGFNPSQFIADNSFNLNIVCDDEPTDTFYYNIVDDDKIYARRLS